MIRIMDSRAIDVTGVTRRYTRSLRTRFLLSMLVGQTVACLVILLPVFKGRDQIILSELQRARLGRVSIAAAPFLQDLSRDPDRAMAAVLDVLSAQPDVVYAAFLTPEGTAAGQVPQGSPPLQREDGIFRSPGHRWIGNHLEVSLPVVRSQARSLVLVTGFDTSLVTDRMDTLLISGVALGLGALVVGYFLTFVMSRHMIASLESFARFAREVAAGNPAPTPLLDSVAELDLLAQTLNRMSAEVERSKQALRRYNEDLEVRVQEKTLELQAAHERLLAADRLATTGRMAAEVAHEIRSPLAAISLGLESMDELAASPECRHEAEKCLRPVRAALARIQALVDGYLSFAQTEDRPPHRLEAHEVLREAEGVLHELQVAELPRVSATTESDLPPVEVDLPRLRVALKALFKNALQAFARREPGSEKHLRITVRGCDQGLAIEVEDNAGGIDPGIASHATDPFVTTYPNRSGLGLPMALQVARDMGGDLELESEPGKGTCARILLPPSSDRQGAKYHGER